MWWIVHTWTGERARYQRAVKAEAKPQTQERCALCIFKTTAHESTKAASDTEHQVVVFDCTLSSAEQQGRAFTQPRVRRKEEPT